MRIQVIDHRPEKVPKKMIGWHLIPIILEKNGCRIDTVGKKEWYKFYFKYLKFKPDIIVSSGIIGALVALLKKFHLINVPHYHAWDDHYLEVMGKKWGMSTTAFFEYFIIKNADFISTPSKFLYYQGKMMGRDDIVYTPHGVDKNFDKVKAVNLKGKVKIIYLGDMSTAYKGVSKIINAVKGINCDLYLIGEPSKELQKNAPKNVHFLGHIAHKEIPGYLKAADIFVLTSDQDSCLKMFEYIKSGKPILAFKGKIGYVLTHGENAYLTEDFGEGLKTLILNPSLCIKLSENIKKFKVYTWDEIANKHLENIKTMLGRKK